MIGAILGYIIARHLITPVLIETQRAFHSLPSWSIKNSVVTYSLIILVILMCSFTAFFAYRSSVKQSPAEAMREKPLKSVENSIIEKICPLLWRKMSFEWKWAMRDVARNKFRTLISIIGVLGSMLLLIAAFGLRTSVEYTNNYIYGTPYSYDAKISINANSNKTEKDILYDLVNDKNAQWIEEASIEVKNDEDTVMSSTLTIVDKGDYVVAYNNGTISGEKVDFSGNDVVISKKLASLFIFMSNKS